MVYPAFQPFTAMTPFLGEFGDPTSFAVQLTRAHLDPSVLGRQTGDKLNEQTGLFTPEQQEWGRQAIMLGGMAALPFIGPAAAGAGAAGAGAAGAETAALGQGVGAAGTGAGIGAGEAAAGAGGAGTGIGGGEIARGLFGTSQAFQPQSQVAFAESQTPDIDIMSDVGTGFISQPEGRMLSVDEIMNFGSKPGIQQSLDTMQPSPGTLAPQPQQSGQTLGQGGANAWADPGPDLQYDSGEPIGPIGSQQAKQRGPGDAFRDFGRAAIGRTAGSAFGHLVAGPLARRLGRKILRDEDQDFANAFGADIAGSFGRIGQSAATGQRASSRDDLSRAQGYLDSIDSYGGQKPSAAALEYEQQAPSGGTQVSEPEVTPEDILSMPRDRNLAQRVAASTRMLNTPFSQPLAMAHQKRLMEEALERQEEMMKSAGG